jgi:hypothetical protein
MELVNLPSIRNQRAARNQHEAGGNCDGRDDCCQHGRILDGRILYSSDEAGESLKRHLGLQASWRRAPVE